MSNTHNLYQYFINNKQNHNLVSEYLDNQSPVIYMNTIEFPDTDYIEARRFGAKYVQQSGTQILYRPDEIYFFNDGSLSSELTAQFINIDTQSCPMFEEKDCELMVFDSYGILVNRANMFWAVKKGQLLLYVRDINILNQNIRLIEPGSKLTVVVLKKYRVNVKNKQGRFNFLKKVSYTLPDVSQIAQFTVSESHVLYPLQDRNIPIGPEYIRVLEKRPTETYFQVVEKSRLNVQLNTAQQAQITVIPKSWETDFVRQKANASSVTIYIGQGSNFLGSRNFKNYQFSVAFDNSYIVNQVLPDVRVLCRIVKKPSNVTLAGGVELLKWYSCEVARSSNGPGNLSQWYIKHPTNGQSWISAGNAQDMTVEVYMYDVKEMSIPRDTTYRVSNGFEFHKLDCLFEYNTDTQDYYIRRQTISEDSTFDLSYLNYNQTTGRYDLDANNKGIPLLTLPDEDGNVFPIPVQYDHELMVFIAGYKMIAGEDYKVMWPDSGDASVPYLFIRLPKKFKLVQGSQIDVVNASIKIIYNGPMENTLQDTFISQVNLNKGNFFQYRKLSQFDRENRKAIVQFNTDGNINEIGPQYIAPFIRSQMFFNDRKLIHPSSIEVIADNILAFKGAYTLQNLECINLYRIDRHSGAILAEYANQFEQTGMIKFMSMIGATHQEVIRDIANYYLTGYVVPENARDNKKDTFFFDKIFNIEQVQVEFLRKRSQMERTSATFQVQYQASQSKISTSDVFVIDSNLDLNQFQDYDVDSDFIPFDIVLNANSNQCVIQDQAEPSKELIILIDSTPV